MVFPVANLNVTVETENESLVVTMFYIKCIPCPVSLSPPLSLSLSLSLSYTHTHTHVRVHTVLHAIIFKEYKLQLHTAVIVALYKGLSNSTSLDFFF